jgi:hypothetical protein
MTSPHSKKPVHLEVTGLAPFPPTLEEWERALIEPVLGRLFETPKLSTTDPKEARDSEAAPSRSLSVGGG